MLSIQLPGDIEAAFTAVRMSTLPPLPEGCIVYLVDLSQSPVPPEQAWQALTPDEQHRAYRFRHPEHQQQYIQCHAMLRRILAKHADVAEPEIELQLSEFGKPALSGSAAQTGITFNISHSGAYAVIAVARNRAVGVDIEQAKQQRDLMDIARHCFAKDEYMAIRELDTPLRTAAFYSCWSRKESFIKATGKGLTMPLDKFAVSVLPDSPATLNAINQEYGNIAHWQMYTLLTPPGYFGALTLATDQDLLD